MFLFSFIAAIIVYLPVIATDSSIAPSVPMVATVNGSTYTYTEGATCVVTQSELIQTVISDDGGGCQYTLTPSILFEVAVYETSVDPTMPGAVWAFTCIAASESEEYPQSIYGPGCQR